MAQQISIPWYYLYAANYLADRRYRKMSLSERGLLFTLLNECWVNESLPVAEVDLAKILGFERDDLKEALTEGVMSYFQVEHGLIRSPELDGYKLKHAERRKKQVEGGRLGAERKRRKLDGHEPQGRPLGSPQGSLNTVNSTLVKSTSVFKEGGLTVTEDDWVSGYTASEGAYPF